MDVKTLKSHIVSKNVESFYIFTGSEWEVQKLYIEQISNLRGEVRRIDSIADVWSGLQSNSLFKKTTVYIARDDKTFMTSEELQRNLARVIGDNVYILLITSVDKRTKFYKTYKDKIIDFEPLKPEILKKYVAKHINLSANNMDRFIEVCEHDYGRCLLEIDKIKQYRIGGKFDDSKKIYDYCFNELLLDGTIYQPPKEAIFDLVDAILDRKPNKSFELLDNCKTRGEATLAILSILYTNAKAVLQLQSCESKNVSESTGLSGWQIKNASKHINKYKISELVYILKLIQKVEVGIKSGKIDEGIAMDYVLVNVI